MRSRDLLRLASSRWYVVALGLGLTVMTALLGVQRPGVYFSDVDVVLLAPTTEHHSNQLQASRDALAPLAGVIVRDWNGTSEPLFTSSGSTTLFGEGVRDGVQVRLRNDGSQWTPLFSSPVVNVQVVGTDPETVAATSRRVVGQLQELLLDRQSRAGVAATDRVSAVVAPAAPTVSHVGGQRWRAVVGIGVAGAGGTALALCLVERFMTRRAGSRRPTDAGWPDSSPAVLTTVRR